VDQLIIRPVRQVRTEIWVSVRIPAIEANVVGKPFTPSLRGVLRGG
jgi:hypothetical protein